MTSYFLRRLLLVIPTFIGITLLVFIITRFVPGGPIERMLAEAEMRSAEYDPGGSGSVRIHNIPLSDEQLRQLEEYYGFDKPVLTSYLLWLKKVVSLDLGTSTRYYEPVWDLIKSKLPVSIFFGLATFFLTYLICIPLGILKALNHKTAFDHVTSVFIFVGYAVPGFVVGIFLLILFASRFEWFPLGGFVSDNFSDLSLWGKTIDLIRHTTLPLIAYLVGEFAVMTLLVKNSLMDHLAADYVRTAMAKGLSFKRAVLKHALRNSLIPIATTFGHIISAFVMGSFLIESVFNLDGLGLLGYDSVIQRDYPVVIGILAITSLLHLIGNILSDICVAIVDPRVQFK